MAIKKIEVEINGTIKKVSIKKSDYATNESKILVSDYMGGKMSGIPCVSTIFTCNPLCLERIKCKGLICHDCYVQQQTYKKGLVQNCTQNYEIMNDRVLGDEEFPRFNKDKTGICRIESFGDVGSATQAMNYVRMCYANPDVTFTMWTKNPGLWDKAFGAYDKPNNLVCILSSPRKNEVTEAWKKYDWVDHVFTVFTLDFVREYSVKINCGGRKCKSCMQCYTLGNKTFFINELEKSDQRKANHTELGLD